MNTPMTIDVTFNFTQDAQGKDPDAYSPTLRRYHQFLWSKPLPSGVVFALDDTIPRFLHHRSDLGEFFLSSDTVIPSFRKEPRIAKWLNDISEAERNEFDHITYTIGGMMLFPGNRIGRHMTINGARGFHPRIKDRFDLTVECIRRYYLRMESPLSSTLTRYADFFDLFGDFKGYLAHFLLQDLVTPDCAAVSFFAPFANFTTSPVPTSIEAYREYRYRAMEFVEARNRRIAHYAQSILGGALRSPRGNEQAG
jgi:hypothetical protein